MKLLFLIFLSSIIGQARSQGLIKLEDDWILDSMQTKYESLVPESNIYTVTFTDSFISYYRGVNRCWSTINISNDSIHYQGIACTEICCDKNAGKLYNKLNYSGHFHFPDRESLVIQNDSGKYFLSRVYLYKK